MGRLVLHGGLTATEQRVAANVSLAKRVVDVGLVPHDVTAMASFYGDVVGLPVSRRSTSVAATLVRYAVGESTLKLLCVDPPPPRGTGGLDAAIGFRLLTLIVADLDGVLARAEAAGVADIDRQTFDAGAVQVPLGLPVRSRRQPPGARRRPRCGTAHCRSA